MKKKILFKGYELLPHRYGEPPFIHYEKKKKEKKKEKKEEQSQPQQKKYKNVKCSLGSVLVRVTFERETESEGAH